MVVRQRLVGPAVVLLWAGTIAVGMGALIQHDLRPAPSVKISSQWPKSVVVRRDADRPTLVMSVHPQCPCSRASLHELEILLARSGERVAARVLFVQPAGAPANWTQTDLWRQASEIPGVTVLIDHDGSDSRAFGAQTSGQVALYDPHGTLLFSGGITDGRGHEGDSAGLAAIIDLLYGREPATRLTPVFGCSLGGCTRPEGKQQ
jgi:hypothetical protein